MRVDGRDGGRQEEPKYFDHNLSNRQKKGKCQLTALGKEPQLLVLAGEDIAYCIETYHWGVRELRDLGLCWPLSGHARQDDRKA